MKDDTIVWLGVLGVGGFLLYKSGIFQSVGNAVQGVGGAVSSVGGAVGDVATGVGSVLTSATSAAAQDIKIANDVLKTILGYAQDIANLPSNIYGSLASNVPQSNYVSPIPRVTQLDIARQQFFSTASAIAAANSGFSNNITGSPTAQLPEKSTTSDTKQSPAAEQRLTTSGGFSTSSSNTSTAVVTKIAPYTQQQLAIKQLQGFSTRGF